MRNLQPFTFAAPDAFRPEVGPDITSTQYATDFNEVKAVGSAMSMGRIAEQIAIAKFWGTNMVIQSQTAYRDIADQQQLNLIDTARLMAMGNVVGTDILVACFDAKYSFSFWRPVTAIRNADIDGNDATALDSMWMPLMMTPNHPEFTAGHGCYMSAQAEVFTQFLGTDQIDIDLISTATNNSRHYKTAADLRTEIINARIWGGLYFRTSFELGVQLGQAVAQSALTVYFQPTNELFSEHAQFSGGIRKFVDTLFGLTEGGANNLGQYIPLAVADTTTYPGSDYYEIAVVEYEEKMHSDLPPTRLRGYVQLETPVI
jgi:hypothetical protein